MGFDNPVSKTRRAQGMPKSLLLLVMAVALSMGVTAQIITPAPSAYGGVEISELLLQKRDDFYPDSDLPYCVTESNYVNSQHVIYCNSFATFVSWSYTNTVTSVTKTFASTSSSSKGTSTSSGSTAATATSTGTSTTTPTPTPSKAGLTTGALIGIGVGGLAAVALLVGLLVWFCMRSRNGKYRNSPNPLGGHNSYDPRYSLPSNPAQYAPIPFDSAGKYQYQPSLSDGPAELSPSAAKAPPVAEHPAYQQYGYPNSGRQSPTPGPEAYLLPVTQKPQHHTHDQPAPGPYTRHLQQQSKYPPQPLQYQTYQPVSPPTQHFSTGSGGNKDHHIRTSTVSELGDTSSIRASSTVFSTTVSTSSLSATGAGGYVSPEDALRTGRVAPGLGG
ncbi:MAG: hypothetical protein M1839_003856 [Geoglossum umbratile]|nr:MAG: hypothetical protein M1839_003856 [Geoglossum umbratile]